LPQQQAAPLDQLAQVLMHPPHLRLHSPPPRMVFSSVLRLPELLVFSSLLSLCKKFLD
jgi:hypothetical protein